MKNITLEQAETLPQKLSIRKNPKKILPVNANWEGFKHHYWKNTWNLLEKFITKYIGKPYNKCYSDFLHKLNEERTFRKEFFRQEIIEDFKCFFHNRWGDSDFSVDSEGNIQKCKKFHRRRKQLYRDYIYKFIPKREYEKYLFIRYFGVKEYNKAINGVSLSMVNTYNLNKDFRRKIFEARYYDYFYYPSFSLLSIFTKVGINPIIGEERLKYHYELKSAQKKAHREYLKEKERKFLAYLEQSKEQKKIEALNNIITRDRLGFDDKSFKKEKTNN